MDFRTDSGKRACPNPKTAPYFVPKASFNGRVDATPHPIRTGYSHGVFHLLFLMLSGSLKDDTENK
jgi:hypothetical protein